MKGLPKSVHSTSGVDQQEVDRKRHKKEGKVFFQILAERAEKQSHAW